MIRLKCTLTFLALLAIFKLSAQSKQELIIGKSLPDFTIPNILHSVKKSVNTSAFKDKLLIIDFWATSCSGCVAALPKMEALQKQFGNDIKILPITFEPESLIVDFWKKNKYTKNLTIPTVVEDKIFRSYFPHEVIPHEIWIYKGKVIGITEASYVDINNIQKVLNGKIPDWPVKNDYYFYDGMKQPLFMTDKDQIDLNSTMLTYAAICDYKEKNGASAAGPFGNSGSVRDSIKKTIRTYFVNQPAFTSYTTNWNAIVNMKNLVKPAFSLDPNQIVWEVIDPTKYMYQSSSTPGFNVGYKGDWMRKNAFCFESLNPDTGQNNKDISRGIINDLDRLLGLKVRWEKRKEKVWNLIRTKKSQSSVVSGTQKISPSEIVMHMNQVPANPYVFNKIEPNDNIKLDLKITSWSNITAIRAALQPYGLDLKQEERLVDKFVFSEVNGSLLVDAEMIDSAKAKREAQKELRSPEEAMNKRFLEENKSKPGVIQLPSGLQYKILKAGLGPMPSESDRVKVHYSGSLVNWKIFESSFEMGRPVDLNISNLIQGWREGLKLMSVGSKWVLYIPAELAYGEKGGVNIPANSTLIFEIELLQIIK